jgi:hypothetical protein
MFEDVLLLHLGLSTCKFHLFMILQKVPRILLDLFFERF